MELFTYILTAMFVCILGGIMGSFVNVVVYRLPLMLDVKWSSENPLFNLAMPRSFCVSCKQTLKVYDNIPVISYLILKGKCRNCKTEISARYLLIEVIAILCSLAVFLRFGISSQTLYGLILSYVLIAAFFIDYDHMIIPDLITLGGLWLGLIANFSHTFVSLHFAVGGAVIGYLFFWCVYWVFRLITHKEGLGYGDFKLLALCGAWFGPLALAPIILVSSLLAICGALIVNFYQKTSVFNNPFPFGPYIAIAAWLMLFFI